MTQMNSSVEALQNSAGTATTNQTSVDQINANLAKQTQGALKSIASDVSALVAASVASFDANIQINCVKARGQ